jgi:DnaJ-class molecular chaperone
MTDDCPACNGGGLLAINGGLSDGLVMCGECNGTGDSDSVATGGQR